MIRLNLTRPCADPRCPACAPAPRNPRPLDDYDGPAPDVEPPAPWQEGTRIADGVDVARWLRAALATAMGKPV